MLSHKSDSMKDEKLTAEDILMLVMDRAQYCRSEGDSDMRNIINLCAVLERYVEEGIPRDKVLGMFEDDEDEDS